MLSVSLPDIYSMEDGYHITESPVYSSASEVLLLVDSELGKQPTHADTHVTYTLSLNASTSRLDLRSTQDSVVAGCLMSRT